MELSSVFQSFSNKVARTEERLLQLFFPTHHRWYLGEFRRYKTLSNKVRLENQALTLISIMQRVTESQEETLQTEEKQALSCLINICLLAVSGR